jgi:hypothetical protein
MVKPGLTHHFLQEIHVQSQEYDNWMETIIFSVSHNWGTTKVKFVKLELDLVPYIISKFQSNGWSKYKNQKEASNLEKNPNFAAT